MNGKKSLVAVIVVFVAVIALAGVAYAALGPRAQDATQGASQPAASSDAVQNAAVSSQVAASSTSSSQETSQAQSSGQPDMDAYDFKVASLSGETVSLSSMKGKPTVVGFWATWCPPCNAEAPTVQTLFERYGDKVNIMMVNCTDGQRDTQDGVRSWIDEHGYTYPVYFDINDLEATYMFQALRLPTTVIFDKSGNVVDYFMGAMDEDSVAQELEGLM